MTPDTPIITLKCFGADTWASCMRRNMQPGEQSVGENVAKIHAEASEALEAWMVRDNTGGKYYYGPDGKPEGVIAELADVVLSCALLAHKLGGDLDKAVREKADYNRTRPATTRRM